MKQFAQQLEDCQEDHQELGRDPFETRFLSPNGLLRVYQRDDGNSVTLDLTFSLFEDNNQPCSSTVSLLSFIDSCAIVTTITVEQ